MLGRRRVSMVGVVIFTAASLLCGLAWSDTALIGARGFQGIGAAIITPSALSIITTTFEEGAERNRALGIWEGLGGTEDGSDPLASTEAFQQFQDGICERCEEAPFVSEVELIGSYGLFGDGDENGP